MKRLTLAICLALLAAPAARPEVLAITGARAVTMTADAPLEAATIVIREGRIAAIGQDVEPPRGAIGIDARGRFVTPGLMNSATQLGLVEVSSAADTVDDEIGAGTLGAAFDVQYGLNPNSTLVPIARADGLTRAVVFPGASADPPFLGRGALLHLRPGPGILQQPHAALFVAVGGATSGESGKSRSAQWQLIRTVFDEALHFQEHEKAYRTAPLREQRLDRRDFAAIEPVLEGDIPLAVFAARESDLREAVALAEDYDLRLVLCGAAEAWRVADLLASRNIPVVLDPFANLPASFDEIGARGDSAAILQRAGVLVGFFVSGIHASHNAGLALREGAGLAVAQGLPWNEALAAITVNPARIWGIARRYGTLEVGRDADVVIWDGDPL
ncbi:amidohydrolase family protein [soil metagenome]